MTMFEQNFQFGEGQMLSNAMRNLDKPYPDASIKDHIYDAEDLGAFRFMLERTIPEIIIGRRRDALTIPSGATAFGITSNFMVVTGAAAVTIGTITGGYIGMIVVVLFTDANVTITDTNTGAINTVNLSVAFTSTANDVLQLMYDGTSWFEISRSVN